MPDGTDPVKSRRRPGPGQSGGVAMLLRLLLAWAAAVPTLGQAPWATEPRAACAPGSCYALFPRRRTFLEAWRACRGRIRDAKGLLFHGNAKFGG